MKPIPFALAACIAGAAHAESHLAEVKFGTNWVPQAEHGGYYQALADGSYAACGLDVEIVPGGPQVNNRALMIAGKLDFYMGGNMILPWFARAEGVPVRVVAAHFQKEPQILMTHPGRADEFADLAGFEKHIVADGGFNSWYQWLIAEHGFSAETRVPYTFNSTAFITDENSVQQGYVTSEPFAIAAEAGWTPDVWLLADHGFNTPSTTVETMEATIAERPEVVKCFVEASSIGWANYLYGDNVAANALIMEANPDLGAAKIAAAVDALKANGIVDSGYALDAGIGAIDPDAVHSFYDKMVTAGVVPDGLDVDASFTTEFSNTGAALEVKKSLTGG